ncbi:hypothetical protein Ptr86124_010698 [Pyrenophora tritici-repentis]|uniref:C2H2-type domain-containing protein n=1 Tax=Pyrenophora tritici-repentis TaxID=45151 RepID=A0A922SX71_9PLEO|nr:hypothetical protein Ptr86124_010698 [Pyrenophora tritici-repentis]
MSEAQGSNVIGQSDECFGSHGHNYGSTTCTSWTLPNESTIPWLDHTVFAPISHNPFLGPPLYPWVDIFEPVMPTIGSGGYFTDTLPVPTPFQGALPIAPALLAPNPSQHRGAGATFRPDVAEPRVRCEHPSCNKTFRRTGDCRRHMRKHNPIRAYSCVVDECRMKFYRLDKLRDHARDGHNIVL